MGPKRLRTSVSGKHTHITSSRDGGKRPPVLHSLASERQVYVCVCVIHLHLRMLAVSLADCLAKVQGRESYPAAARNDLLMSVAVRW